LLDDLPDEPPRDDEAREPDFELRALFDDRPPDFRLPPLLPLDFRLPPRFLDDEPPLLREPPLLLPPLLREPPREDFDPDAIELCSSVWVC
jgi:hypothetical protein